MLASTWRVVGTDLTFSDEWAESLFVEINQTMGKNIIVGTVYRPPDKNLREFLNDLDRLLDIVSKENKTVILMEDWNLNIMNSIHNLSSLFLDLLYYRMFFSFITRPTRITSHKASLIDNIFSCLFFNDISDHLPIFSLVSGKAQSCNNPSKYITFRDKSAHNVARFRNELSDINWREIPGFDNPSEAYGIFLSRFTSIYNKCFPLKKVKANKCNFSKPWFSKGLANSVKKKICCIDAFFAILVLRMRLFIKNTKILLNEFLNRKKRISSLPSIFKKILMNSLILKK